MPDIQGTTDLTRKYAGAKAENPALIDRDHELELMTIALLRQEKPNIVLEGDPGVGKTALVNQLAYNIAQKKVPTDLQQMRVVEVNTSALLAGDGLRGQTEKVFTQVVNDAVAHKRTILFFDEFHTVQNLGRMNEGQTPGLSNMLKPYLTRREFRVIGATTTEEARQLNDLAFRRRFYFLTVEEPSERALLDIAKQSFERYASGLRVKKECIRHCYETSLVMTTGARNPDKLNDLIDLVCARAKYKGVKTITSEFIDDCYQSQFQNVRTGDNIPDTEDAQIAWAEK